MQSSTSILDEAVLIMAGPSVTVGQNQILSAIPSSVEIREVVFGLNKSSFLGPDGFPGAFSTNCSHINSPDVIQVVSHFFSIGRLLRAANAYFLTLLPKKQSPMTFSAYRPISLLNFTYTTISKILAATLSIILPLLISKHHSAIVKSRYIHHHVALAHDIFKKLKSNIRGGSIYMKLDISKAFDKPRWNFLFRALQFFNFSSQWVNLMT